MATVRGARSRASSTHVGWLFNNLGMEQGRIYGKDDLYEDNLVVWVDRLYLIWIVLTLGIPASARHGLQRWQLDVSWWVIRGLEKVGLVWNVKVPDADQIGRRRLQPSDS